MKRRRALTEDEARLWRRATADVAPFSPRAGTPAGEETGDASSAARSRARDLSASAPIDAGAAGARRASAGIVRAASAPDVFRAGDPRREKYAARGRMAIDARLDLHGYRLLEAEIAFFGFLQRGAENGARCLLVITGKGDARGGSGDAPYAAHGDRPRGVIRQRFFDWARSSRAAAHIARVAPAHRRHGGDGAFYIFLKRRRSGPGASGA